MDDQNTCLRPNLLRCNLFDQSFLLLSLAPHNSVFSNEIMRLARQLEVANRCTQRNPPRVVCKRPTIMWWIGINWRRNSLAAATAALVKGSTVLQRYVQDAVLQFFRNEVEEFRFNCCSHDVIYHHIKIIARWLNT